MESFVIPTLFLLLFFCMMIGVPVAVSLGFSSIVTILLFADDSLASIALKLFEIRSDLNFVFHNNSLLINKFMVRNQIGLDMQLYFVAMLH